MHERIGDGLELLDEGPDAARQGNHCGIPMPNRLDAVRCSQQRRRSSQLGVGLVRVRCCGGRLLRFTSASRFYAAQMARPAANCSSKQFLNWFPIGQDRNRPARVVQVGLMVVDSKFAIQRRQQAIAVHDAMDRMFSPGICGADNLSHL